MSAYDNSLRQTCLDRSKQYLKLDARQKLVDWFVTIIISLSVCVLILSAAFSIGVIGYRTLMLPITQ